MSRSGSALRATAWVSGAQVTAQALGLVMTLVLARRLGLVGFGEYALASAVLFVANVVTTFGTDMVLVREIAAAGVVRRAGAAALLQLGLSVAVVGALWPVAPASIRVLSLALFPAALFAVCTAVLRGVGMMRTYAVICVGSAALPALAVIALVPAGAGVVRAVTVLLGAQAAAALCAWALCVARVRGFSAVPQASLREVGTMARDSAPVGVLGLLGMAYQRLPVIILGIAVGPAATGWFTAASRTVEASKTGHVGLFSAIYPALARAHAAEMQGDRGSLPLTNDDASRRDLRRVLQLCAGLGALVTIVLLLLGPVLLERLFGHAFAPATGGLRILAIAVIPSTLATYRSLVLLAAHREATTLRVLGASLLVLAAATAVLLPAMGWIGACWAVVIAETAQAALMLATTVWHAPRTTSRSGNTLTSVVQNG